jgi:hypothetical protein
MDNEVAKAPSGAGTVHSGDLRAYLHGTLIPSMQTDEPLTLKLFGLDYPTFYERMLCMCGFPGAWCFTAEPATRTALKGPPGDTQLATVETVTAPSSVASFRGTATAFRTSTPVAGPPVTAVAPVGRSDLKISVWWPEWSPEIKANAMEDPRWNGWGRHEVIPLQLILNTRVYSTEAEIVAELAAGTFAWGPNWSPRAQNAWVAVEPNLVSQPMDLKRRRLRIPNFADNNQ